MSLKSRASLLLGLAALVAMTAAQPRPVRAGDWLNTGAVLKTNQQIASLWTDHGKEMAKGALYGALDDLNHQYFEVNGGNTKIWILDLLDKSANLNLSPGFEKMDFTGVKLRLPLVGAWSASAKYRVKIRQKVVANFWVEKIFDLTANVSNVWARAQVNINSADPEAPVIGSIPPPQVNLTVVLSTNVWYLTVLTTVATPFLNNAIDDAMAAAIDQMMPSLQPLAGQPQPYGTGGPAVTDSGAPTNFLAPALHISQKIRLNHLPFGSLVETDYSTPYTGTWAQSLADPNFSPGTPTGQYGGWGDSAIWSGHYLAAEAFRYKVAPSGNGLSNLQTVLGGIDMLTQMRGVPGLLNRMVRPAALYPPGPGDYVMPYNGVNYVCSKFISRDQYMGVFMGLSTAYDFVNNSGVKATCRANIERMLDYLLMNKWVAYQPDGTISTTWHLNYPQQLAWLRAGLRVNPSKYALAWLQHAPLSDLVWVAPWTETFDPVKNSYYKFNLEHGAFYTLLRLETIPFLWQRDWKGMRIMRKALAHHQNAHFNMCEIGSKPSLATGPMGGETRELLRKWLQRPRRDISANTWDDPTIAKVWYQPLSISFLGGDVEPPGWMAQLPIPVEKRGATDFLWQRSPFGLNHGGGSPHAESPGVDYILPYWMGRYYGVFQN